MFKKIKYFIQRGRKGYSTFDLYSLSYYLADLISNALKEFKENEFMGIPTRIYEESKENEKVALKKWNKILDKIIDTFETVKKITESEVIYIPTDTPNFKEARESFRKLAKELPAKLLTYKEAKKYEEGFDLFKKYFLDLWI